MPIGESSKETSTVTQKESLTRKARCTKIVGKRATIQERENLRTSKREILLEIKENVSLDELMSIK